MDGGVLTRMWRSENPKLAIGNILIRWLLIRWLLIRWLLIRWLLILHVKTNKNEYFYPIVRIRVAVYTCRPPWSRDVLFYYSRPRGIPIFFRCFPRGISNPRQFLFVASDSFTDRWDIRRADSDLQYCYLAERATISMSYWKRYLQASAFPGLQFRD